MAEDSKSKGGREKMPDRLGIRILIFKKKKKKGRGQRIQGQK